MGRGPGRRGRMLTRGRAAQNGCTALFISAQQGHLEVVRARI